MTVGATHTRLSSRTAVNVAVRPLKDPAPGTTSRGQGRLVSCLWGLKICRLHGSHRKWPRRPNSRRSTTRPRNSYDCGTEPAPVQTDPRESTDTTN